MTFYVQGFAIFPWGPPSQEKEQKLNDALENDESSKGELVRRGAYKSELSKALFDFVMDGISVCFA